MKRSKFSRRSSIDRDAEQLAKLAIGLAESNSRMEDGFWQERLSQEIDRLLRTGNEDALNLALELLYQTESPAYDELADLIESRSEGGAVTSNAGPLDMVMFASPLLAWSRFTIPSGALSADTLAIMRAQLQAHVFAADTNLALTDFLFSPDQLPRGYVETYRLTNHLIKPALENQNLHIDPDQLPETTRFVSDTRYIVGAIMAPHGKALFRWQEEDGTRELVTEQWQTQAGKALQPLFSGCALELHLPDAFHSACRNADRELRIYSLRAAVIFLQTALNVLAHNLRAVVAPFCDDRTEEYRIGFTLMDANEIVHGVVWPMLEIDEDGVNTVTQIETVLHQAGVNNIIVLDQRFPMEFCDDCGMPMFPTPEGETMHAELPEDSTTTAVLLH